MCSNGQVQVVRSFWGALVTYPPSVGYPVELSGMIQMRKSGSPMFFICARGANGDCFLPAIELGVPHCSKMFKLIPFLQIFLLIRNSSYSTSHLPPFQADEVFLERKLDLEVFVALPQCILRDTQRCKARRECRGPARVWRRWRWRFHKKDRVAHVGWLNFSSTHPHMSHIIISP